MEEIKTTTYRVKEAVAATIEKAAANPDGMYAVAELGQAYASILDAETRQNAASVGSKLLEELNNL
jgi:hypothetical protein